jgi:hypothetical protein
VFQDTPIYSRLIAERGDVPAQVRGEADRIHRHLAQTMRLPAPHGTSSPGLSHAAAEPRPSRPAAAP